MKKVLFLLFVCFTLTIFSFEIVKADEGGYVWFDFYDLNVLQGAFLVFPPLLVLLYVLPSTIWKISL